MQIPHPKGKSGVRDDKSQAGGEEGGKKGKGGPQRTRRKPGGHGEKQNSRSLPAESSGTQRTRTPKDKTGVRDDKRGLLRKEQKGHAIATKRRRRGWF